MSETVYVQNPEVVLHEEDEDGALVFNPDNDNIRVLNQTGRFIWSRCDGKHSISQIVEAVQNGFSDAPGERLPGEVEGFLKELCEAGFVKRVTP